MRRPDFIGLVGSVAVLWPLVARAQSIDELSAAFLVGMEKECNSIQRADPQNRNLSDRQIAQYCNCIATHSLQVITIDEMVALERTGQHPTSMQNKLNALGKTCGEVYLGRTKDDSNH
jgi:hypothetical protein